MGDVAAVMKKNGLKRKWRWGICSYPIKGSTIITFATDCGLSIVEKSNTRQIDNQGDENTPFITSIGVDFPHKASRYALHFICLISCRYCYFFDRRASFPTNRKKKTNSGVNFFLSLTPTLRPEIDQPG